MTLASRGGRGSTSTEFPVIGGSDHYKGACTGPLFYFPSSLTPQTAFTKFAHLAGKCCIFPISLAALMTACSKKVSGRWGCRPLGRGGWRDFCLKLNPSLKGQVVPLRSPAAEQHTGARSPGSFRHSESRTELPTTEVIVRDPAGSVTRRKGSFSPVLRIGTSVPVRMLCVEDPRQRGVALRHGVVRGVTGQWMLAYAMLLGPCMT
jgi:hypothetical protein